ncbi:MAG: redox-sensing transcriptional repressor Rex [Bacteroidetes bacterium]|nr:MAG: redox-sensing transcriptional repressor Rex [Bacteroidota bacterium]
MNEGKQYRIPEPSLKRLPRYLYYLKQLRESGLLTISGPMIGKALNCDPTQVVKDIAFTGASGRPRVGYSIPELVNSIENALGFDHENEAFLVGAGHLGMALMSYPRFADYGLRIIAAFDCNPEKIGRSRSGINVIHVDKFADMAARLQVQIGILTTPAEAAQQACDMMVASGIRAIWNLTPTELEVPEELVVQNTSMYANVAVLLQSLKLKDNQRNL